MSEPLRSEVRPENTWALEDIFPSDDRWEDAFSNAKSAIRALARFKGLLQNRARLLEALDAYFSAARSIDALNTYAAMRRDEDTARPKYQALSDRARALATEFDAESSFIAPELALIDAAALEETARDPAFSDYDVFLRETLRARAHTLSAGEERVLALAGDMSMAAREVYELLTSADMRFDEIIGEDGGKIQITQGSYVKTLMSRDRRVRQDAYRSYYKTYMACENAIPAAYAGSVKADQFYACARGFASCRDQALFQDNIPPSVYDNLIGETRRHLPSLNRLLTVNARLIGLDKLAMCDMYVPAVSDFSLSLPFDEAYDLVAECLSPLGSDYQEVLRRAKRERWIDPYENKNKHPGAYAWGTYDAHPYVLLNYHENLDGLLTVAHEMGHAMHTYYSAKAQPYPKADYSMFAAEVASTVNEVLVLSELMKRHEARNAQAYLLYHLLDAYRSTLFRQVMFAEFERETHLMAERGAALTGESLNKLYDDLNRAYYPSVDQGPEAAYEWMRIPHFYRAFYVFVYATGFSAATAIASALLEKGESAQKGYRAFLAAGGSLFPIEALRLAGIDMASPEPVARALDLFEKMLARYEKVAG